MQISGIENKLVSASIYSQVVWDGVYARNDFMQGNAAPARLLPCTGR